MNVSMVTFSSCLFKCRASLCRSLSPACSNGYPILHLIEQPRALVLLVTFLTNMPAPSSYSDAKRIEEEEEAAAKSLAETNAATEQLLKEAADVEAAEAEAAAPLATHAGDPNEDPDMRVLKLEIEAKMIMIMKK
jgi:hypothetical protein